MSAGESQDCGSVGTGGMRQMSALCCSLQARGIQYEHAQPSEFRVVPAGADRLRGDPARRQDYATVKRELARLHANDRAAYMAGKDELVRRLLRLALDQYALRDRP
jgi:hypothetical protein